MSASAASLVSVSGLCVEAGGNLLLDGIELQLQAGEVLGIVGPNGAGKSTLLRVLAGVLAPDAGEVLLEGKALGSISANRRARSLGYMEQRPFVHWPLRVNQVAALGWLPHGDPASARAQQLTAAALAATDCNALHERLFHTLSEGEKVRVHLARVLTGQPRLILADEPIAALDPWHQLQVLELLRAEAARGTGVALVLHDLQLAARYCDRLAVLHQGRLLANGKPREVLSDALLAQVWRLDARFDSATLALNIYGRV